MKALGPGGPSDEVKAGAEGSCVRGGPCSPWTHHEVKAGARVRGGPRSPVGTPRSTGRGLKGVARGGAKERLLHALWWSTDTDNDVTGIMT